MTPVRVGVIGLGLIGGSIARRLADETAGFEVSGFDADEQTTDAARATGIAMATSVDELATAADLVVVAVPPQPTASLIAAVLTGNRDALVTDVASVKVPILQQLRNQEPEALARYLPSHPLSGAETSGWDSANPDLLDKSVWAVCPPSADAPAGLLAAWGSLFDAFDARVVVCDPTEHDLALARTSHAPHLAAAVIAASLASELPPELAAALSGGAFRDMTRTARSDPALWSEILELNRDDVAAVVDEWIAGLRELRDGRIAETWERARSMLELVERLRWREPVWEPREFGWPAWDELLGLGRRGIALRRISASGDHLHAEVAAGA